MFRVQGPDFKNKKTMKEELHREYYCFLFEKFYLGPIGGEKQNFTSFLLVEIQLFIKKTQIFLIKFL